MNLARTEIPQPNLNLKKQKSSGAGQINFGSDNLYPQECAELFRESSTLHAVISKKADYFSGTEIESTQEPYKNAKGYGQKEIYRRCSLDYYLAGNCYVMLHRVGGTVQMYHIDQGKVRRNAELSKGFLVSANWASYRQKEYKPFEVAEYKEGETKWSTIEGKEGEFAIYHIMDYEPSFDYYGLPDWVGATYYAKLEMLIGQFNSNMFDNGLFSSGVLRLSQEGLSPDETRRFVNDINAKLVGTEKGNSGKIIIFTGDQDTVDFTELTTSFEGSYIELKQMVEDTVISAASWYRSLSGLSTEGQLGNNQQILNEYQIAMQDIKRTRSLILPQLDRLASEFGLWSDDYEIIDEPPITISSSALNGAQVMAMVAVAQAVGAGTLSSDAAKEIYKIGYNLSDEDAEILANSLDL